MELTRFRGQFILFRRNEMKKLKMRLKVLLPWIGLALSFAGNVCLVSLLINAGSLVDGAQSQADLLWERREVALEILRNDWLGRPVAELDNLAIKLQADGVPVSRDGETREIGDFLFHVESGVVSDIRDFDSPPRNR